MFELRIITQFAAAHYLRNYQGKCEQLHGHNWKVEVFVRTDRLNSAGLGRDFGELKTVTQEALNGLDHRHLNELALFQAENPSSENIARYLFHELSHCLNDEQVKVSKVAVWESDTACATYIGE